MGSKRVQRRGAKRQRPSVFSPSSPVTQTNIPTITPLSPEASSPTPSFERIDAKRGALGQGGPKPALSKNVQTTNQDASSGTNSDSQSDHDDDMYPPAPTPITSNPNQQLKQDAIQTNTSETQTSSHPSKLEIDCEDNIQQGSCVIPPTPTAAASTNTNATVQHTLPNNDRSTSISSSYGTHDVLDNNNNRQSLSKDQNDQQQRPSSSTQHSQVYQTQQIPSRPSTGNGNRQLVESNSQSHLIQSNSMQILPPSLHSFTTDGSTIVASQSNQIIRLRSERDLLRDRSMLQEITLDESKLTIEQYSKHSEKTLQQLVEEKEKAEEKQLEAQKRLDETRIKNKQEIAELKEQVVKLNQEITRTKSQSNVNNNDTNQQSNQAQCCTIM